MFIVSKAVTIRIDEDLKQQVGASYLTKLEESLEEARNGQAYQFLGKGKFSETPQGIDL